MVIASASTWRPGRVRWDFGPPASRLVALHGFTGDGLDYSALAESLAARNAPFGVSAPDLPGHGSSSAEPGACAFDGQVAEIVDLLAQESGRFAPLLLGYSMGARLALAAALDPRRGPLRGLILVSGHPGLRTDDERLARRASDEAWARRLEAEGTASFLRDWQAQPLLAPQLATPGAAARSERRARAHPDGLAAALRGAGTHAMPDLRPRLPSLSLPVLVVTGDADAKFTALGDELMTALPHATRCRLPCGHAPHLEAPDALADAIVAFDRGPLG